jgi:AcrR family transcriptional regulator
MGGLDAVSTWAVAAAAGVQAPTIYRQFGDNDRLLDAVVRFESQGYIQKKRLLAENPGDDVRRLCDLHAEFGMKQQGALFGAFTVAPPLASLHRR